MHLSVIIVNYNVKYFLEQAIKSVLTAAKDLNVEIIVVDNCSTDGSVEMIQTRFPEVVLIANQNNPGFSIANNQGLAIARGQYILFLNPDTVVSESTIHSCLSYMEKNPAVGALGVKMVDGAGQFLPESKRGLPTPKVAISKALGLHKLFPQSPAFNWYYMGHIPENKVGEIEILCGAFMWIRKSVLDVIGGFDEQFFMYGEDIDLSYRIIKEGYKIVYFPETTIIHYKGESTKKGSLNYVKHFYQAMLIFANKHFKNGYPFFLRFLLLLGVYFGAGTAIVKRFFKSVSWPVLDTVLLVSIILAVKQFWAIFYYEDPDYYTRTFYAFNLPVYVIIWLLTLYFSGSYDRPFKTNRLIKAMILGLLLNGLVYGLLSNPYRPSRAIMVMTFVLGTLSMVGIRWLIHYIRFKKWPFGRHMIKRIAIVSTGADAARIGAISKPLSAKSEIVGYINNNREGSMHYLGHVEDIQDIARVHRLDELIFSTEHYSTSQVMKFMNILGPKYQYKLAASGSSGIVGSSNKNSSGEWYTLDLNYHLAMPEYRRMKRTLDFVVAFLALVLSPLIIWWIPAKYLFLRSGVNILLGSQTWVGYLGGDEEIQGLPKLKPALFPLRSADEKLSKEQKVMINRTYAEKYHYSYDLEIIWLRLWTLKKE